MLVLLAKRPISQPLHDRVGSKIIILLDHSFGIRVDATAGKKRSCSAGIFNVSVATTLTFAFMLRDFFLPQPSSHIGTLRPPQTASIELMSKSILYHAMKSRPIKIFDCRPSITHAR